MYSGRELVIHDCIPAYEKEAEVMVVSLCLDVESMRCKMRIKGCNSINVSMKHEIQ